MTSRVAVIGAGPSGLAQLRAFESAAISGTAIPEIVCFERQADWGGQWNYTWRTGLDEHGEPVHSSMYRNLWSNGPKECLEFADYSFDEHFGRAISSYPPRAVLWDYIKGRVERSGVRRHVRFRTAVRWVVPDAAGGYALTSEDLTDGTTRTERFDQVVVATGHFSVPHVPAFPGIESFPGRVIHAHDFRGAEDLAGKNLLLIGSSYSAEDIGIQAHKMGAASVTFSYRTAPMGFGWPATLEEKPLVTRFEGRRAFFADGTSRSFDAVVLCTGYQHRFPFLPDELTLRTRNVLYPDGLYKGVVFEGAPDLYYLGMQDQWFTFNMFDAQAWFVRDVILGRITLPDAAARRADIDGWLARQDAFETIRDQVRFQADYIQDLIALTDYPSFDLDELVEMFLSWKHDKAVDILSYRDVCYRSVMTGSMAAPHHTRWIEAMDDTLEAYLAPGPATAASTPAALETGAEPEPVPAS